MGLVLLNQPIQQSIFFGLTVRFTSPYRRASANLVARELAPAGSRRAPLPATAAQSSGSKLPRHRGSAIACFFQLSAG
ncbi:hypothetical protein C1X65_19255 [Pseudomonas sp. FW305-70]|nr:hypothetical protein C1X65_19255 [Pseudomonas sp. FW305-70]